MSRNSLQSRHFNPGQQGGFTLVELMVSSAIGLLITAALIVLYVNTSRTNSEMAQANQMIESGRFSIQFLEDDIVHAGFWGDLGYTSAAGSAMPVAAAIPNPCVPAGWNGDLLAIPVQGFENADTLGTCNVTGVLASSDILVVNHANNCEYGASCEGGSDTGPHIQVSACQAGIPAPEAAYVIASSPTAVTLTLRQSDCATAAPSRKIVSNIYFLATSDGVPNLKRVTLANGAYTQPQPLIEGIEAFQVEFGIDTLGKNGDPISASNPGDGSADTYVVCAPCTLSQLSNAVAVKIYVLSRNLRTTQGYSDTKTYTLGSVAPAYTICSTAGSCTNKVLDPGFKRHEFATTIRLVNPSSRREAP